MIKHIDSTQQPLGGLHIICLSLLIFLTSSSHAMAATDDPDEDPYSDNDINVQHRGDTMVMTVIAWSVMVITLEVNDFRHRLAVSYDKDDDDDNSNNNNILLSQNNITSSMQKSNRYIGALVAIRYGLIDGIIDWSIMYSIGYAIVAGCTWTNAEPESVVVIQGFSNILSAAILGVASFKLPEWLGVYHRSKSRTLRDTSGLASKAIEDLTTEGSTLKSLRYQVRLGVGKHFSQWIYILLPFYVDLKVWWALLSVLIGLVLGYLILFIVFKCRQRFKKHREYVAICASICLSIFSALAFTRGMYIVQEGWDYMMGESDVVFTISFFGWLVFCLLVNAWKYYKNKHVVAEDVDEDGARAILFDDTMKNEGNEEDLGDVDVETRVDDDGAVLETPSELEESGDSPSTRPGLSSHHDRASFFGSGYFNRVKHHQIRETNDGADGAGDVYNDIVKMEEADGGGVKWYQCMWQALPIQVAWTLFVMGTKTTFGCCREESYFKSLTSCWQKGWFVLTRIIKICMNCLALYVAIIACGATIQRSITIVRLPLSFEHTYKYQNEGPVCAFSEKCGEFRTFESNNLAVLNNFTVAHCGACGLCSNWHDLPFQLIDLAVPSRTCGQKNFLFRGEAFLTRVQKCHEENIGFSPDCSWNWANNVECSRKNCAFIFMQSLMTNQVANFKVGPKTITSATCSESACEAGPDYWFVGGLANQYEGVGANRRRMNVESEIKRPKKEQCKNVGIPLNKNGYPAWDSFLGVSVNTDVNTVEPTPICPEKSE